MRRAGRSTQSCGNARFSAARPPARAFRRSRKRARDYPVAQRRIASAPRYAIPPGGISYFSASGLILHGRGRVHKKKRAQTPSVSSTFQSVLRSSPDHSYRLRRHQTELCSRSLWNTARKTGQQIHPDALSGARSDLLRREYYEITNGQRRQRPSCWPLLRQMPCGGASFSAGLRALRQ